MRDRRRRPDLSAELAIGCVSKTSVSETVKTTTYPQGVSGGLAIVRRHVFETVGYPEDVTPEQEVREILARMGFTDYRTNGDIVELANLVAENRKLQKRQQELLATIVRITNETPFVDEAADALKQRGVLLAEIGTLRRQLAEALATTSASPGCQCDCDACGHCSRAMLTVEELANLRRTRKPA